MKTACKWVAGVFLGTTLVWQVSHFFISSMGVHTVDPATGAMVIEEGETVRWRSEGWADSRFGKHGIPTNVEFGARTPAVFIWGDSLVEGFQVEDPAKMGAVVTSLSSDSSSGAMRGVCIAHSGRNVADHLALIPQYEALRLGVKLHVIVFGEMGDILPIGRPGNGNAFVCRPELALVAVPWDLPGRNAARIVERYRLQFARRAAGRVASADLRFGVGPQAGRQSETHIVPERLRREAFAFLLKAVQDATQKPVVFLYVPPIPRVRDGRICFEDANAEVVRDFRDSCTEHDVGFIDAGPRFRKLYETTDRFPRGFPNSHPWRGHLNEMGHKAVAEAIIDYVKANDVILQD